MTAPSIYRTPGGEARIRELYRRSLDSLDVEFDESWIETRYGETHVLETGPTDGRPVVVFHGGNVTNPVSLEWFLPLADEHRLYAPDTIGHPGLSAQTRLSPRDGSYGRWVVDLLDGLGLEAPAMIGPSYGGGIVLRTAAYAPERIGAAALVVPSGLATGSALRMLREIVLPALLYRLRPSRNRLLRAVQPMFTEPAATLDADLLALIDAVFRSVRLERSFPRNATAAELAGFTAPTLLIAAEDDLFFPPEAVVPAARSVIPNLEGTLVLNGESHFPSPRGREAIVDRIRAFLETRT
jgi:pimeloyl-ACP methyl ester carboxylesterase